MKNILILLIIVNSSLFSYDLVNQNLSTLDEINFTKELPHKEKTDSIIQQAKSSMLLDGPFNPRLMGFYKTMIPKQYEYLVDEYQTVVKQSKNPILNESIFYFVSSSLSAKRIINIKKQVNKLQNRYPNVKFKMILQGFNFDLSNKLGDYMENNTTTKEKLSLKMDKVKMKVDPLIYKDLNLTKVPALAFAMCKNNIIYPSNCDIKYLARGDITLDRFFELLSEQTKDQNKFKEYYLEIIQNNSNTIN